MKRLEAPLDLSSNSNFPAGSQVTLTVRDKLTDFLIGKHQRDRKHLSPSWSQEFLEKYKIIRSYILLECQLGDLILEYSFLYMPACPIFPVEILFVN